jgi:hypothetical protein
MKSYICGIIIGITIIVSVYQYSYASCGSTPGKPSTPSGCSDLELMCRCDQDGKNCTWEWICVEEDVRQG